MYLVNKIILDNLGGTDSISWKALGEDLLFPEESLRLAAVSAWSGELLPAFLMACPHNQLSHFLTINFLVSFLWHSGPCHVRQCQPLSGVRPIPWVSLGSWEGLSRVAMIWLPLTRAHSGTKESCWRAERSGLGMKLMCPKDGLLLSCGWKGNRDSVCLFLLSQQIV